VALGIPFTLCFTLIAGKFLGYTINGVTLAGIIIVLGIVVDDAIIVAENITRRVNEGEPIYEAAVKGTQEVVPPILASILTTCAAFIPLFFFTGRFGHFIKFIPPIIFLMLLASVVESFFLLPAHMTMFPQKQNKPSAKQWFIRWETKYENILKSVLPKRYWVIMFFVVLMVGTGFLAKSQFNFVMFPDEESREIVLSGSVDHSSSSIETATFIQPIEDYLQTYVGKEAVGIRTAVARGRRGDTSQENQFRITLEIVAKENRQKSSNDLMKEIKTYVNSLSGISKLRFRKRRFGQSSGSAFEITVQENNDINRESLSESLMAALKKNPNISNIEPDVIPLQKEYTIDFSQTQLKRLSVSPLAIASTLRTVLTGKRLFTIFRNDEEVDVNLTVLDEYRNDITKTMQVPVENNRGYLVPLKDLVTVREIMAKKTIRRLDQKRSSFVYADLSTDASQSPLEVAEVIERDIFPKLLAEYPSAQLSFDGEVVDTRESRRDLMIGVMVALTLIYLVLAILFNSAFKPFRIMLVIPFGVIGVVIAFYLHQKLSFGFYAAIGTLGMLGVVVNDAIVMLNKLDKTAKTSFTDLVFTASVAKTRLRAILLTTITTVAGVMPTAYGIGGIDTMLSDMMIALAWGLLFGTAITLILTPCVYMIEQDIKRLFSRKINKMASVLMTVFLLCFCFNAPVFANDETLSLEDFIVKAAQKDTFFHALLIDRLRFAYDQDLNVEASELALSLASEFAIDAPNQSDSHTIALSQTFPQSGQEFAVSYSELTGTSQTSSFTFSQDIARNAFGHSVRLDSDIQSLKTEVAKHQLVEAYEDYMAELISLYYTWIRQYESLELAGSAYRENEKVLQSIVNRKRQKIANTTDVNKLKLQTLAKKEQIIRFERDYQDTTNQIRRSIGMLSSAPLNPDTTIILDVALSPLNEELSQIRRNSRTFKVLEKLQKQALLKQDRSAQDLLPSAQLSASIADNSETYGMIGLSIGLPLSNTQAKAGYEVSKLQHKETAIQNMTIDQRLITLIRNIHSALTAQKKLINVAIEKRRLAKQILKSESENYSYGKITLNDYISAVNRYDSARFDEIDRKISYQ